MTRQDDTGGKCCDEKQQDNKNIPCDYHRRFVQAQRAQKYDATSAIKKLSVTEEYHTNTMLTPKTSSSAISNPPFCSTVQYSITPSPDGTRQHGFDKTGNPHIAQP